MSRVIRILFIDDNNIEDEIERIKRTSSRRGIRIESDVVNIDDDKFRDIVNKGEFDVANLNSQKIFDYIESQGYQNIAYDVVACDFNFSDEYLDGYQFLTKFINRANDSRHSIRNAKFMFYTGDVHKLEKVAASDIRRLLRSKIESIVDRSNLPDQMIRIINKIIVDIDPKKMVVSFLEQYKDLQFNSTYTDFKGKKLSEISEQIQDGSDKGSEFLENLINLSMAHLITMQEN